MPQIWRLQVTPDLPYELDFILFSTNKEYEIVYLKQMTIRKRLKAIKLTELNSYKPVLSRMVNLKPAEVNCQGYELKAKNIMLARDTRI
jgi:hypothetical protein